MKQIPFAGLRAAFPGAPVHTIIVNQLDNEFESKQPELRICVAAKLATVKTVIVNEVKGIKLPGGKDGLAINGGAHGLTFSENDSLIDSIEQLSVESADVTKKWFGSMSVARDICNAQNEGEIIRLTAIMDQCKAEIEALKAINTANDNAVAANK